MHSKCIDGVASTLNEFKMLKRQNDEGFMSIKNLMIVYHTVNEAEKELSAEDIAYWSGLDIRVCQRHAKTLADNGLIRRMNRHGNQGGGFNYVRKTEAV